MRQAGLRSRGNHHIEICVGDTRGDRGAHHQAVASTTPPTPTCHRRLIHWAW
jgi:hypothetical protein